MPTIRRSNLPLSALRTFEVAARHLSFKLAADGLFVSAAAVRNQIRHLEKDLNCKLFLIRIRDVDLTEAGQSLSQILTPSLNDVSHKLDRLTASENQKPTLTVGPVFGSRWMFPRLNGFRKDSTNKVI
ncbi:LysR family transcriptional regulator [Pseudophaeobacter sp.]|uniref:LysR family transcriptional regulator n=1 Tax=Pseudophaeobacter sp. TaxID=1971739 RepID=UPI00405A4695